MGKLENSEQRREKYNVLRASVMQACWFKMRMRWEQDEACLCESE